MITKQFLLFALFLTNLISVCLAREHLKTVKENGNEKQRNGKSKLTFSNSS
jgi:hypothetical protein